MMPIQIFPPWVSLLIQYLPTVIRLAPSLAKAIREVLDNIHHSDCKLQPAEQKAVVEDRKQRLAVAVKAAANGDHSLLSEMHQRTKV